MPLVHIIDRKADKLLHLRRFVRCARLLLIRANDVRRLLHDGQRCWLSALEVKLKDQFKYTREVYYKGKKADQYVAETPVVLAQPARRVRKRNGQTTQRDVPGPPLTLRLVLAQVRDQSGRVLAADCRVPAQQRPPKRSCNRSSRSDRHSLSDS